MNETIAKIVNMLFDDIQETEETRARGRKLAKTVRSVIRICWTAA